MHPFETLWTLAADSVRADVLSLALEHQLFDRLKEPKTPQQLAGIQGWQPEKTGFLLELLWSMQLLQRDNAGYVTTATCLSVLCRDGEHFLGDAWRYRLSSLRHFGQGLATGLDKPLTQQFSELPRDEAWAHAAEHQISQEQRAITAEYANSLISTLPDFPQINRMLDLGGGPGWVAITLAQTHPHLSGCIYDLPQTAAVAQRNINAAGLSDRLSAKSGDFTEQRYDLIWSSSFLHFVEDIPTILTDLHRALTPEGVLVLAQAEIAETAADAAPVLPFFLPLLMSGRHVTREGQLAQWLYHAGFASVETRHHQVFPMAPLTTLIARKCADKP
ncbi:class I SAM-dependent methyltransferase [Pectobacterium sp. B1J-3]|uniref:class I SAM-dependent methyltransferase n=1 Tax=Pectobacterium sp. B1J-3 TaxID=3385371 RepID=UPI003905775D